MAPVALEQLPLLSIPVPRSPSADMSPSPGTLPCPPIHPYSLPFPLQCFLQFVVQSFCGLETPCGQGVCLHIPCSVAGPERMWGAWPFSLHLWAFLCYPLSWLSASPAPGPLLSPWRLAPHPWSSSSLTLLPKSSHLGTKL